MSGGSRKAEGRGWLAPSAFVAMAFASLALFWQLRWSVRFIDETDVPVFGRLVAQGRVLHLDLFSQHTHLEPMAAWMVAKLFPQAGLPAYRGLIWLLQLLAALALASSALFERRDSGWIAGGLYLLLATAIGPLWYGHMILAYNLWGALCAASLGLVYLPWLADKEAGRWAELLGGAVTSFWIMGTPFTIYPVAALLALMMAASAWSDPKRLLPCLAGFMAGLGVQAAWLVVHADLGRLWEQTIVLNAKVFAPFAGEPVGQLARFGVVAQDLKQLLLHERLLERLFPLLALAGALALYRFGAAKAGKLRAMAAALLALAFFVGLRMRGGHWRAMPFVFVSLMVGCAVLGLLIDRGRVKAALALYFLLALAGIQGLRANRPLYGMDSFAGEPALELAKGWATGLAADETVLVVPVGSWVYLLAGRAPGMDGIHLYPWIMEWERQGGRGLHGTFCQQVGHFRPRYILLDRGASVWAFKWADYQPACLDGLLVSGYVRRPFAGKEELWERKKDGRRVSGEQPSGAE